MKKMKGKSKLNAGHGKVGRIGREYVDKLRDFANGLLQRHS